MVINLRGIDKYDSNNVGDRQTYNQTITKVCTGEIYEYVRSNGVTHGVMERWTLMIWVSHNAGHS